MSPFIEATPSEMRFDCLRLEGKLPERITWFFECTWGNFIMFAYLQSIEVSWHSPTYLGGYGIALKAAEQTTLYIVRSASTTRNTPNYENDFEATSQWRSI
jgi:hypothetical protein